MTSVPPPTALPAAVLDHPHRRVVSQQVPNAPHESYGQERFTAALPGPASMRARDDEPPAHLNP
jgi:hypothetical protein